MEESITISPMYRDPIGSNNCILIPLFQCIAELQIKPKQKSGQTKNLERLYNCLVSLLLVRHAQNSSDVTLAFEDAD